MVKQTHQYTYSSEGTIDISAWLEQLNHTYSLQPNLFLNHACHLTQSLTVGLTTFYGKSCFELGLEVAEILLALGLDQETAAAGVISTALVLTPSIEEKLRATFDESTLKLIKAVHQMELVTTQQVQHQAQIDKRRKMLLAIATDIRAVIIKLAERLSTMRGIKSIPIDERQRIAQEILDIYAPLANRLGIGQLKWELEDLAFHYLDPTIYKTIAHFLAERRIDREKNIHSHILLLQQKLHALSIHGDVTGRAKHIYSIYLKAKRKGLGYQEIYDCSAVRILVPTIEDCYTALSIVHSLWPPIMEEFDDYIANPKSNGYRSIHTAVNDEHEKHFEIQIRTISMHEEAERGIAAHWLYKEKKTQPFDDTAKISHLRQLLDWHKEIAQQGTEEIKNQHAPIVDDEVYVITPQGDIIDLPHGATPLDFAYYIHSELGHRCRGAKINGQIVPLTYALRTGDKVDITTIVQGTPSRDWLNAELGYLKTSRARSKVSHWFKQQAFNEDVASGRQLLEREFSRHAIAKTMSLQTMARHFNLKTEDALLASLGRGNVRIGQIIQFIQPKPIEKPQTTLPIVKGAQEKSSAAIAGAADLLTRMAKCCKPIPGDAIIGYITQGRGISIHKINCNNMKHVADANRFIQIHWDKSNLEMFSTDLKIVTQDQASILNDLTSLFVNEKINLLNFNSTFNKHVNRIIIIVTIQIQSIEQLQKILHRMQQLPGVLEVERLVK